MNYATMRDKTVKPLLEKYGQTIYLIGATSTATGWVKSFDGGTGGFLWTNSSTGAVVYVDPTTNPVTTKTALVAVEKSYLQDEIDGSVILENDRRFIVQGDVTLKPGDELEVDSSTATVKVVSAKRFSPSTINMAWEVHCRG